MTEARRKWQKDRRAKAAKRGKCSTCVVRWPLYPNKTCDSCLEVAARSAAKQQVSEAA